MTDIEILLEKTLHDEIPITLPMGLSVKEANDKRVILTAPLEPNINHKSTAFGGSLYAVAVLTGWSMVFVQLKKRQIHAHIVIQEAKIKYFSPVHSDLEVVCEASREDFDRCFTTYEKRGQGRVVLKAFIINEGKKLLAFEGKYVIHR